MWKSRCEKAKLYLSDQGWVFQTFALQTNASANHIVCVEQTSHPSRAHFPCLSAYRGPSLGKCEKDKIFRVLITRFGMWTFHIWCHLFILLLFTHGHYIFIYVFIYLFFTNISIPWWSTPKCTQKWSVRPNSYNHSCCRGQNTAFSSHFN